MAVNGCKPEHTLFCPENCAVKHNEMIMALCAISDDSRKPPDLGALKVALYSHLQTGWNAQSSVPDALTEFQFPLVHWACVLGRTQVLSWLLSKMKFKAFVVAERTGESGLHRALRLLHRVRSRDTTPRSVDFICSKFSLVLYSLTEQDPSGLFLKDKVQGNSAFHVCALCISQQQAVSGELEYYENCMKNLLIRVSSLQTMERLPKDALHMAVNERNDLGETVLHILARSNISAKTVKYLLSDYREIVNKSAKNSEGKTPLDIAQEHKADLIERELGEEIAERLVRSHPDLYQLFTEDTQQVSSSGSCCDEETDSVSRQKRFQADGFKGYSLRLSSLVTRDGFYRNSASKGRTSDDNFSQSDSGCPLSLLDPMLVSYPEISASTTDNSSAAGDNSNSLVISHSVPTNATAEQESCVPVDLVENSVVIDLEEDETDDEQLSCGTAVVNCVADGGSLSSAAAQIYISSDSLSESSPLSQSVLSLEESEDVPESARACATLQDGDTCSLLSESSIGRENGECSSLLRVIRQESDVASILVARLQDKKEQNRMELRQAQRDLTTKQKKEGQANCILVQLRAERENILAQMNNLKKRREELMEELKNTEKNISHLQEESLRLQSSVDEQVRITDTVKTERQKASEACVSLKRKFTEYSEALSDICFPSEGQIAKKERKDDA